MPAWEIKLFGGMMPLIDSRLIGDTMAQASVNCDLTSGELHGLFAPVMVKDFTATPGPVERAYLFIVRNRPPVWIPFPHRFTSVVRSPLANDDLHRLYWTVPGHKTPYWSTYDRLTGETPTPPWSLGTIHPTVPPVIADITGGTTTVPEISRAYVYTYINQIGEESAPSPPSNVEDGPPDASWTIISLPTTAPSNPGGTNYPPITTVVVYRTVTGEQTGTQYFEVTRYTLPHSGTFVDTIHDDDIVNNLVLQTAGWNNPPDFLDGLVAMPGGMLLGFTGNTIHFCEPDRPHTWPQLYDQSVHYEIVALAVWQQYLMVLTQGYPSTGSGNSPSNFLLVQTQVPEPCVSRGSVVTDLVAVYYASQNGLIQLSGYGISNQTLHLVDKEMWQEFYKASSIIAARHRTQYLALRYGYGMGFTLDSADQRLAFNELTILKDAVCIWNDEYFGDTYICANKKIYRWDDTSQRRVPYRWRSKRFFAPTPISLGAVQVTLGPEVMDPPRQEDTNPPLDNGCPDLPAGANAVFRYFAGPEYQLVMERILTSQQELFRLPAGFRAFDHQCEVVSLVPIYSIQLATTMTELRGV